MSSVSNDFNKSLIEKWRKLQLELREKLILSDTELWAEDIDRIELIGGMDISYDKNDNSKGCVASVVLDAKNGFNILYKHLNNITISNPYVAGFLAFREVHFLVEEFQLLKQNKPELLPNVWLIDGNGIDIALYQNY
jgi:deoxyinosine 3'endonuclease (endonuclease V)